MLLAALLLVPALGAAPAWAEDAPRPGLISLQGVGSVEATPDIATVTTGVVSEADTARAALDANNAAMSALMDVLRNAGIAARDIQTSGFSVQPRYVYPANRDNGETLPPRIVGYEVSNSVAIRVRDLTALGSVLDQVVSAGSNTISNVTFDVAEPAALLENARKAAMKDAIGKAKTYAEAAGISLGRITSINESGGYMPKAAPIAMRADAESAVPMAAGEVSYSVTVSVEWEIAQ